MAHDPLDAIGLAGFVLFWLGVSFTRPYRSLKDYATAIWGGLCAMLAIAVLVSYFTGEAPKGQTFESGVALVDSVTVTSLVFYLVWRWASTRERKTSDA